MASHVQAAMIAACGFEPTGDTWDYDDHGSSNCFLSSKLGEADTPPLQRVFAGDFAWSVFGNTISTLDFHSMILAGYTDRFVRYHLSATGIESNGHSGLDFVDARLAETVGGLDDVAVAAVHLVGNENAVWGFHNETLQQTATWDAGLCDRQPGGGGVRTADGYNDFKIVIPNDRPSVALRLSIRNSSNKTFWNLDDVSLEGTPTDSHDCRWAGGNGMWRTTQAATTWDDATTGTAAVAWNNQNGDNARFDLPGSVVTIASETTIAARSLIFDADNCTIARDSNSSVLALVCGGSNGAGANTIQVTNAGDTATIQTIITGNPGLGLVKTGAGTLILDNHSIYTGATTIREGTLAFVKGSSTLSEVIDVENGATLDLSAFDAYAFANGAVIRGEGTIVGNLHINRSGVHDVGCSPGIQQVFGDYVMAGELLIDVCGSILGDPSLGYDQVLVSDSNPLAASHNVRLSGSLNLNWTATDELLAGDQLWILRNDTTGQLVGQFCNFGNEDVLRDIQGHRWKIYYGADADTGRFSGGNDVLLALQSVPEPSSLGLILPLLLTLFCRRTLPRLGKPFA